MARRLLPLLLVALVAVGCAASGAPETFTDQPGPIDADLEAALDDGADPDLVPLAQRNFLEGCAKGGASALDSQLADLEGEGLLAVCGCTYDGFTEHFIAEAATALDGERAGFDPDTNPTDAEDLARRAYELFIEADDEISNAEELEANVPLRTVVQQCIDAESGALN